ncbi:MAG: hypothetical protein L6R38_003791 [Xanthoria sp. 2 TBL-2021]|nr:MAG: hypothetical protein L6R38_003791 [Xanthoria sp. 2 TBL-2021]
MSNLDELTKRDVGLAAASTCSSDHSSDSEDEEIEQAIQNLIHELGLLGASQSTNRSDGRDLRYSTDIEEQDDIEDSSETTGAKIDEVVRVKDVSHTLPNSKTGESKDAAVPQLEGTFHLEEAEVHGDFISCLPSRPFQAGLGSLSVLPPEIRLQIWEIIIPTTNFRIKLEPEQLQRLKNSDLPKVEDINTLGLLRTSKQIHDEIDTQFYRNRSLAVIFTTTRDPSARGVNIRKAQSSNPGLILDGTYSSGVLRFINFAKFTSIKLLIELPGPISGMIDFQDLADSTWRFSRHFSRWQMDTRRQMRAHWQIGMPFPEASSPRIEIIIYTRMHLDDMKDDIGREMHLTCLAILLQPLRSIQNSTGATVEADYSLRYGKEWLPELLSQVADDMQKGGMSNCVQWRQKNMLVALAQCDLFTKATLGNEDGGPLPIGLPEALTDDTTEYVSDTPCFYEKSDYRIYLDTGELPHRPPGRPIKIDANILDSEHPRASCPKTPNLRRSTSADIYPESSNMVFLHQKAAKGRSSTQSIPSPFNSLESSREQQSHSNSQASKDQVPSSGPGKIAGTSGEYRGQSITQAANAPATRPWNLYNMSLTPRAKGISPTQQAKTRPELYPNKATKKHMPDPAKLTNLEFIAACILLFIVLAWIQHTLDQ